MHSAVKYIVNELNKPPYNKRFNIVSFDSLSSEDLLQVSNYIFNLFRFFCYTEFQLSLHLISWYTKLTYVCNIT